MSHTDIQDLHGMFPTPLRWSAENGVLGVSVYDDASGERVIEEIELSSPAAKFVMDYGCRERGYGLIRQGLYDMRLTPVGAPPPPFPDDPDFKPAVGMWLWNPQGEVRLETNGAILRTAISALWDRCRSFKEASDGLQPVIHFTGRQERMVKAVGKVFWAPVIDIIGWVDRNKIPSFAAREPTVKPPAVLDSQVRHQLLEHLQPARGRAKAKPSSSTKGTLNDFLDDQIPDLG